MPDFATEQYEMIAGIAGSGAPRIAKMGTVAARSPGSVSDPDHGPNWASVTVDPGGTPQPVKCFESVVVDVGDRVGLIKFEGEWLIVANYTLRTLGEGGFENGYSGAATTTSVTFVDMPTAPSIILPKYRDATLLRIDIWLSMYVTAQPTVIEIGASVASFDGTVDIDLFTSRRSFNAANDHRDVAGGVTTDALAGGQTYEVTARWRRISGTGVLTTDANDSITMRVREVVS